MKLGGLHHSEGGADYGWIPLSHYSQAAANTEVVGQWLGGVTNHLISSICPRTRQPMPPKPQVWGVGHSLGAHVLGMAGRNSSKNFDRTFGQGWLLVYKKHMVLESACEALLGEGVDPV